MIWRSRGRAAGHERAAPALHTRAHGPTPMWTRVTTLAAGLLSAFLSHGAAAQELEPRAYSPSPVGTTFILVSATRSVGGVFTDPSAPITDVEATVGLLGLTAGHTFEIAGKQALLLGFLPIAWGEASGNVGEDRREVSRRGLADARVRFSARQRKASRR